MRFYASDVSNAAPDGDGAFYGISKETGVFMKNWILRAVPVIVLGVVAVGCQEKPDLKFSEYGETIPCLPRVENLPVAFPYPAAEVETRACSFAEEAAENAKKKWRENEEKRIAFENKTSAETAENKK